MRNRNRVVFGVVGTVLLLFLAWTVYTPVPFTSLKITALGSLLLLWVGIGLSSKIGKWICLVVAVGFGLLALWPTRAPNSSQLRTRYLASLVSYRNTPYVWGGENGRGIDCSGLMRRAIIDALLSEGWHDVNPALWREAGLVWWRDCSAREMKNGYGGRIVALFQTRSLNALDTSDLKVGDLAVLESGVHVLAFVGGKTWIQADPNLVNGGDKVIETTAPTRNGWFGQRVVICRWKMLS